jgi:hypothetical protein
MSRNQRFQPPLQQVSPRRAVDLAEMRATPLTLKCGAQHKLGLFLPALPVAHHHPQRLPDLARLQSTHALVAVPLPGMHAARGPRNPLTIVT